MATREEIKKAIETCIAIEQSCGGFDGNRLAEQIMRVENELGVAIKVDRELPTDALGGNKELNQIVQQLYVPIRVERIQDNDLVLFAQFLKILFKSVGYVVVAPLIKEG